MYWRSINVLQFYRCNITLQWAPTCPSSSTSKLQHCWAIRIVFVSAMYITPHMYLLCTSLHICICYVHHSTHISAMYITPHIYLLCTSLHTYICYVHHSTHTSAMYIICICYVHYSTQNIRSSQPHRTNNNILTNRTPDITLSDGWLDSHSLKLMWVFTVDIFSHIFSSAGIQDVARWQFSKHTHCPSRCACSTTACATGPWNQPQLCADPSEWT